MPTRKLAIVVLFLSTALPACAKPMPAPDMGQALTASTVVVATFQGFRNIREATYFSGTTSSYRVTKLISTAPNSPGKIKPGKIIRVNYAFQDGSACIAPKDWQPDIGKLPRRGSGWILFLSERKQGRYTTYRGSWGRKPFSDALLAKIRVKLKNRLKP